jgi:hypothetical protein
MQRASGIPGSALIAKQNIAALDSTPIGKTWYYNVAAAPCSVTHIN